MERALALRLSACARMIAPVLLLSTATWAQPAAVGEWSKVMEWPDNGTHLILLPTGKVLSWNEFDPKEMNLWDPETGAHSEAEHPGYNTFCAGHALLADGTLLVAGGHIDSNRGLKYASIYDPVRDSWTRLPDMNAGRWYPTNTALPNGDMLVIAGTVTARKVGENRLPQVWQRKSQTWRDLTTARLTLQQYPWMFVAPNGKVFNAGPDPVARYLDTEGTGQWTDVAESLHGDRFAGTAIMYDDGKIMVCGGGEKFPTETVEVIDLNDPTPRFRAVAPMRQPRKQHNATLLPDGTVLVSGGSSGPGKNDGSSPVLAPELWDPLTETFTVLAPHKVFRGYHSSALLLPDGRVLAGGGDFKNFEIFSPPYLFKGERPRISASPEAIAWGEPFKLLTADAAAISKVTLLKLGSSTHAFNQSQRIHTLPFTRGVGFLDVTPPANGVAAAPGHYMLFILNEAGVPSVGAIIRLGDKASMPVGGPSDAPEEKPAPVSCGAVPPPTGSGGTDGVDGGEAGDGALVATTATATSSDACCCATSGSGPAVIPLLVGLGWALRQWRRYRLSTGA